MTPRTLDLRVDLDDDPREVAPDCARCYYPRQPLAANLPNNEVAQGSRHVDHGVRRQHLTKDGVCPELVEFVAKIRPIVRAGRQSDSQLSHGRLGHRIGLSLDMPQKVSRLRRLGTVELANEHLDRDFEAAREVVVSGSSDAQGVRYIRHLVGDRLELGRRALEASLELQLQRASDPGSRVFVQNEASELVRCLWPQSRWNDLWNAAEAVYKVVERANGQGVVRTANQIASCSNEEVGDLVYVSWIEDDGHEAIRPLRIQLVGDDLRFPRRAKSLARLLLPLRSALVGLRANDDHAIGIGDLPIHPEGPAGGRVLLVELIKVGVDVVPGSERLNEVEHPLPVRCVVMRVAHEHAEPVAALFSLSH